MNYKFFLLTIALTSLIVGSGCTNLSSLEGVQNNTTVEESTDFVVGDSVLALWSKQSWYQATIDSVCEGGFGVVYYDGIKKCLTRNELIKDKVSDVSSIIVGTKVIAQWTGTAYYDAEIIKVTGQTFTVRYYDNIEKDLLLNQMRLDTRPVEDLVTTSTPMVTVISIGDKILAERKISTTVNTASITDTCDGGFSVRYYDGSEDCLKTSQIIKDVLSELGSYKVGSKVVAQYGNANIYYTASVISINGDVVTVKYYDDVVSDLSASQMRLDTRQ